MPQETRALAIGATFTAEAIQPAMAFWVAQLGLDCEVRFAGYGQLFQELLDPESLFGRNRGFNVALVRFEDWAAAGIEDSARMLAKALREAAGRLRAPLIMAVCPARGHVEESARAAALVREATAAMHSIHWLAPEAVSELYPVAEVHDPHGEELGHVPYTPLYFAALATAIARRIHALALPPFKVAALDCDDTLWAGICGEDGPQGVVIDEPRLALQHFMAERRREGLLLALCSKNNEEDVLETFRAHPEMPLGPEDFAARRIDWESKGANLAALAEELGLGLESFILVDDNPKECREAQAGAPDALMLPLPADAVEIPEFLRHVWAFDRARVTDEDRGRATMYAEQAQRARAEREAVSLEEFLASLELEVAMAPMQPADAARVAQLTQRTNQMNTTLLRRNEGEIRSLDDECWTVRVRDRFGDYGMTGAMIFRHSAEALVADAFVLSCRALGRGVEHRMIARLGEIALERGLRRVEIPFVAGTRNRPAQILLQSIGGGSLTAEEAAGVKYKASSPADARGPVEPVAKRRDGAGARPSIDYVRIAMELRDPAAVLRAARTTQAGGVKHDGPTAAPRTALESQLAGIWAELLNVPAVGIHDNFFASGGHSLLAVQLLSRVRQVLGVDVSLEVVYSGDFTVAELAKAIELKEIEQAGGDYQDLLRELEGLSDDEVRAMLAKEQGAS